MSSLITADPQEMFGTAELFYEAGAVLDEAAGKRPPLMIPAVIWFAFSCELYLKCLIRIEGNEPKGRHALNKLFFELTMDSQTAIRKACEDDVKSYIKWFEQLHKEHIKTPPPKVDFDFLLDRSANAFEKLRYQFEKAQGQRLMGAYEGWLGGGICWAVRQRIIALHPEWQQVPSTPPTSPTP